MFHIITPTYNRAHTIQRVINSVLKQKITDWHLYIIDDGSTDNTKEIIKPYLEKYKDKITYVYKENGGVGSARNIGIDLALKNSKDLENDWVIFLDSDDELTENALELIKNKINIFLNKDKNIKIISFGTKNNLGKETFFMKKDNQIINYGQMLSGKYIDGELNTIIKLNLLYKTKIKFDENINGGEQIFWFKLIKYTNKVATTTTTITRIYYEDNISLLRGNLNIKKINNQIIMYKKVLNLFENDLKQFSPGRLGIYYLVLSRMYALKKQYFNSIKFLIKGIKYKIDLKRIILILISLLPFGLKINNYLIYLQNKKLGK